MRATCRKQITSNTDGRTEAQGAALSSYKALLSSPSPRSTVGRHLRAKTKRNRILGSSFTPFPTGMRAGLCISAARQSRTRRTRDGRKAWLAVGVFRMA